MNFGKMWLFFGIVSVLTFPISNAYSDTFDEQTCLSLISTDQIKEISGLEDRVNVRVIDVDLESLNEGIISGCAIAFENEDRSFVLSFTVTVSDSERTAQSKYGEMFSASHQMGFEVIEGNNGPWIHHMVKINENGLGIVLASIKDNVQIGINSPLTEIKVESSEMTEILKIVQSNIDGLGIPKSPSLPNPTPDVHDSSASQKVKVIFDRCENNDIWWGHIENGGGERIRDATVTMFNQAGEEWGQLSVNKEDGSFGISTIGQDPSSTIGHIQVITDNELPVIIDIPSCFQKIGGETMEKTAMPNDNDGGGCLIATATYGTELAPQVQQLREIRDGQLLQTESGTNFMNMFNKFYYSFSPHVADYERENPIFRESAKIAITPMVWTLSLMEHAESESEILATGISLIVLNLGMYVGMPAIMIIGIKKRFQT